MRLQYLTDIPSGIPPVITRIEGACFPKGWGGAVLHPSIVLLQALPYLLGMVLWGPAWTAGARGAARVLSAGLFLITLIVYAPLLAAPDRWGGDMIGLAFAGISIAMTAAVLLASVVAFIVLRLRR